MRHSRIAVVALSALLCVPMAAFAQTRVAPPTAVESAPLAPPPGAAVPAQAQPVPNPPAAVPEPVPGPQPVQPAPAPQRPVTPEPVQPAPTPQLPLEPQPVQPPPTLPAPGPVQPVQPPTQQQTGVPDPNATLAGKRGDPSDVDPVLLVAKPVLTLSGTAGWDEGFKRLAESFRILRQEAAKAQLPIAGRPLTLFLETDDNGFRYQAMLPVGQGPAGVPALGNGVRAGMSPEGPSLRFVHIAPYDDIDSTYETITAYLEAKSITVKDAFLEEYVGELTDPADPNLEINVYVQPR
ncbi:MAG TPA: GyrI-like domain-containing protein [Bosea sp. (in: a-proteobacteria)]|uniref:GyrI-like domain-containing protein n=1 Tax=Bosea sp. (in: a-proteobacteria) TaxID=1871050 RepID=UPI002E0D165C|nr:GyrI-like domain-containing protein [Bosea sp. (in: a-proteobacteria)]